MSGPTDIAHLIRESVQMEPGAPEHVTGWFVVNDGENQMLCDLRDSGASVTAGPGHPMKITQIEYQRDQGHSWDATGARLTLSAGSVPNALSAPLS